jgi:hypothetical protein
LQRGSGGRGLKALANDSISAFSLWDGWGASGQEPFAAASETSARVAQETVLRPTDIVVVTFQKTGTTWLQQICEQLRTGGDMSFSEIMERQPWLDIAWDCGQDLNADQAVEPRIFKSHQRLSAVNTGAKYISIVRNPADVLQSWFAFYKAKHIESCASCSDVNEYATTGEFEELNIWGHYSDLWGARNEPNVLVQCYEALVDDEEAYLSRIAEFVGVPLDADRLQTVIRMSSKSFMLSHDAQFDDNFIYERCIHGTPVAKVSTEEKAVLTPATVSWLQRLWDERMLPRTGLQDYQALATAVSALARGVRP